MAESADVVIIGGGIMGASLAFHLARRGVRNVLLIEKRTIASGASGKTGALLRQHYSNVPEATLAHLSLQTFRNWRDVVGGDCDFVNTGLIATVATGPGYETNIDLMRRNVAMQQQVGIKTALLTASQLRDLQPFGNFDDLAVAAYEAESGVVDAIAATQGMARAAESQGARIREGVEATGIRCQGERASGVDTSAGPVEAGVVVCAAGAWSVPLLQGVGVRAPIEAIRVQVAFLNRPLSMPAEGHMAYVDTAANMFCRPWGPNSTMVGIGGGEFHDTVDPNHYSEGNDPAFPPLVQRYLSRRMPPMQAATYLYGHAGLYDMTPDAHPILDRAPGLDGLYLMLGFSGAGFKKGPAVGQCMAELITDGRASTVDLAPFRFSRFLDDTWKQPWSDTEYQFSSDFGHRF
ncbi:MAG TPA: FAD-dependent oxidoreductase [Ktedonobacterales bacterium]|nr:FAD-dependent oxidoreductase [Ktedonobacterales bacterium]